MSSRAQPFDLDALEFAVVRALLTARLTTPLGRTAVEALAPAGDPAEVAERLAATAALAARLGERNELPLSGAVEVRSWLERFVAGEHALQARDIADLKRVLRTSDRCRRWCGAGAGPLQRFASGAPDLEDLVGELEQLVDDRGEVLDSASLRLGQVRRDIEAAKQAVDVAMAKVLADAEVRRCLQAPEPAWRHGRPVLQVKTDYRQRVRGVLHDRSASGATLFVEPDAVVEAANRLSDAQAAENHEINVVLADAARGLRRHADELTAAVQFVAAADLLQAKARLVANDGYTVPEVLEGGPLRLRGARHPLLLAGANPAPVVPLDIALGDPHHLLVVTGPNTGGKTVVLKTIGLLALMATAGVPIPAAAGAQVPFLRAVRADIGDEQAIAQNLSTFSSHVQRIARCVESAAPDALVLLDELGAGTDPEEGAVLGYAVLEALTKAQVFAVVTTHLGRLKDFAYQHQGAENGSMAFDGETLRPLYRLDLGIPGNSHALDIAARVGMPMAIVDRARALLGTRDRTLDNLIERVQVARRDAEQDRQRTADRSRVVEARESELAERLAAAVKKENWLQEEADGVVERELRRAQAAMHEHLQALASAPGQHGERARALKAVVDGLSKQAALHRRRMAFCHRLKKGDQVFLPRWSRTCPVLKVDKVRELVVVEYGRVRMEVPFEDISWLQPLGDG
ncbi:MAG: endonuclease MutS2 [Planctomycetes bacterium]|nr:endonuclease MutS2 [Planctomycetota bacterium]